jgi:N-acetylmuramoyl-L-alanine amidase
VPDPLHVCVDPGHQAKPDWRPEPVWPGAERTKPRCAPGTRGLLTRRPEHQITLEVSLLLATELRARGARVTLTRDEPDASISNSERALLAGEVGADVALRIHCDGVRRAARPFGLFFRGSLTLVPGRAHLDRALHRDSRHIAERLHPALLRATGFRDRGIAERDDLAGFNWSPVPVVLLELGYLTNPWEERQLTRTDAQRRIATELSEALCPGIGRGLP